MSSNFIDLSLTVLLSIVSIISILFSVITIANNKLEFRKFRKYKKYKNILKHLLKDKNLTISFFKPRVFLSTQHNYGLDPELYNKKIDIKLLENNSFNIYMKRK